MVDMFKGTLRFVAATCLGYGPLNIQGGVDGLDTSCADDLTRPPVLLDEASFTRYLEEELAPLIR